MPLVKYSQPGWGKLISRYLYNTKSEEVLLCWLWSKLWPNLTYYIGQPFHHSPFTVLSPFVRANCFRSLCVLSSAEGHLETHKAMELILLLIISTLQGSRKKTYLIGGRKHNFSVAVQKKVLLQLLQPSPWNNKLPPWTKYQNLDNSMPAGTFQSGQKMKDGDICCSVTQIPLCSRIAFYSKPPWAISPSIKHDPLFQ